MSEIQIEPLTGGKKVETEAEAWDAQDTQEGKPHGWIQWKGTNVCMDVRCACGAFGHVDAGFTYYVLCPHCGRKYFVNGHVELIEVASKEVDLTVIEMSRDSSMEELEG